MEHIALKNLLERAGITDMDTVSAIYNIIFKKLSIITPDNGCIVHHKIDGGSDLSVFKSAIQEMLEVIGDYVKQYMPEKGNTCEWCQRHCIIQSLNEVHYMVNGIDLKDFKEDEEDEEDNE